MFRRSKGRITKSLIGLGVMAVIIAGCVPVFEPGSTVTATVDGQFANISWPAATPLGNPVASYQVEVNGTVVASVAAPATTCTLTGLLYLSTYDVRVTAFDVDGRWSGNLKAPAEDRQAATGSFSTGFEGIDATGSINCVNPLDSDGDRLPNAVETNTGTFVNLNNTGTNPNVADTDGDGIEDGDDAMGTSAGLDLAFAYGTKPTKKDLLLEFDWFDDSQGCAAHSHAPSASSIATVQTMFANAPVSNPDGTTGINFVGEIGNLIAGNGTIGSGVASAEYNAFKAANFDANRNGYFHYSLMGHNYGTTSSSGQAFINGDDMIVTLNCYSTEQILAGTIAHELGHNLSLRHAGGTNGPNYKPNYNSVMNYQFQFGGIDTIYDGAFSSVNGDGVVDYSTGSRAALNELALTETAGVGLGPIDWNQSGVALDVTARDINPFNWGGGPNGDGSFETLTDYDDWGNLFLGGISPGAGSGNFPPLEIVTEQDVPQN